jgi:hypothetical protein
MATVGGRDVEARVRAHQGDTVYAAVDGCRSAPDRMASVRAGDRLPRRDFLGGQQAIHSPSLQAAVRRPAPRG